MESELEKFRRKKQREQKTAEIKEKLKTTANSWATSFYAALLPNWNDNNDEDNQEEESSSPTPGLGQSTISSVKPNKWLMYLVIFFRFLAWLLVYIGFLKIGFGAVFFTISLLFFIYWNTRKSRKKGEMSAYSVFNKDCQSIDGTLKAEHLEKQLLYRS